MRLPSAQIRGRVHKVSVIRGGELSVVLRFGIEEMHNARALTPGMLVRITREVSSAIHGEGNHPERQQSNTPS